MTEYDDDPVAHRLEQQIRISNDNAVYLNGLVSLLLEKGLITTEELRVHRLRELSSFDRVQAKLMEASAESAEDLE